MARIEPPGAAAAAVTTVPFSEVAEVEVNHSLGRRPFVQVLVEETGGIMGFGGFGGGGFGSSTVYSPMNPANFSLLHLDTDSFKVEMTNYFTGEISYL
jgi:hypothetical protein